MFSANTLTLSLLLALTASTSVAALGGASGHSHVARHHRIQHVRRGDLARDEPMAKKRGLKKRSRRSCKPRTSSVPAPSPAATLAAAAAVDPSEEEESTVSSVIPTSKTEIEIAPIRTITDSSVASTSTPTRTITDSSVAASNPTDTTDDNDNNSTDDDEPTTVAATLETTSIDATTERTSTAPETTSIDVTTERTSTTPAAPTKTSSKTVQPTKQASSGSTGSSGVGKPANWPSATQAGAAPASFITSSADPFLSELSKSYNNKANAFYSRTYKGQMTYYGQGLGACGDTYDDNSMTAAVSKLLYDAWPGASSAQNLNPICGPFVPGRKTINNAGQFVAASITKADGRNFALIGGDGRINCDAVTQCHVPLTATVKHGGKSIIVSIVDRCEGCAIGDIDLTPAAFELLADPALGRTDVEWSFNQY